MRQPSLSWLKVIPNARPVISIAGRLGIDRSAFLRILAYFFFQRDKILKKYIVQSKN